MEQVASNKSSQLITEEYFSKHINIATIYKSNKNLNYLQK